MFRTEWALGKTRGTPARELDLLSHTFAARPWIFSALHLLAEENNLTATVPGKRICAEVSPLWKIRSSILEGTTVSWSVWLGLMLLVLAPRALWGLVAAQLQPQERGNAPQVETAEFHIGQGYNHLKDGRLQEAADEFRAALDLNPRLDRARFQLGMCLFALGEREDSRKEFTRLLSATGGDPGVIYYLGRLDLVEGHLDSAIRRLQQLAPEPPFPDSAYYLGSAYLKKGDLALAEHWLQKATKATPLDPRVPEMLVRLYQRTGRLAEAEKAYRLAAALRKRSYEHTEQAEACIRALETLPLDEARPVCQRLFDPQDPLKLVNLGIIYGQHGYYGEALQPLRLAAQLDPDSYEVHHNLGLSYYELKRYADARTALKNAVELRPDFFGSNALLGATLFALGEDEAAFGVLSHAYQLNPDHRDTQDLLARTALALAMRRYVSKDYVACLKYLRQAADLRPEDPEIEQRLAEVTSLARQNSEHESKKEASKQ